MPWVHHDSSQKGFSKRFSISGQQITERFVLKRYLGEEMHNTIRLSTTIQPLRHMEAGDAGINFLIMILGLLVIR